MKIEPKGFLLEADGVFYNCVICHASISGSTGWWDSNGEKCLACQNAIESGVIPSYLCSDRNSWYVTHELINKFKISSSVISTWVREGKLKSRKIKALSGSTNFEVFLRDENEILDSYTRN